MNRRKVAALRAMASQTDSPQEAEIARRKLADLEALAAHDAPESVWERIKRREAEEEQVQRLREEAKIADIVRRWEQGAFRGVTMRVGATTAHSFSDVAQ